MSGSILRKKANRSLCKNAAVVAFFLFSVFFVFIVLFLLPGNASVEALPAAPVLSDPQGEYLPLLLEEYNNVLLACSGAEDTLLLCLDGKTGEVLLQNEIPAPSSWAVRRGAHLLVLEYSENDVILVAYDAGTLSELSRSSLPFHPDRLVQFDCGMNGTVYYTLSDSPHTLWMLSASGEEKQEFPGPVEYLETAGDRSLLVFAAGKLFYARQGGTFQEIPCLAPPYKRLGDTMLIDQDGIVSTLKTDEAGMFLAPLFRCSEQLTDAFSFSLDGENCLIVSNGSTVLRYDTEGQTLGSCHLASVPLALCPAGAILRDGEMLSYSALSFVREDPPSDSSAFPSESDPSEKDPSTEKPPIEMEAQYILMPAGSTAADLRELFKPGSVKICDLAGKQITQGKLATGMTADDWFIVIKGDCNGTGTVNSADLRTALSLFLKSGLVTDAYSRAVDLNDNGAVDTQDLLLLSAMVGKQGKR